MNNRPIIIIKATFLVLFCLSCYFYISEIIRPELIFHNQQSGFLRDSIFFSSYLQHPGGLTEYAAAFIAQSFVDNGFGSVVIVTLLFFLIVGSSILLKSIKNNCLYILASYTPAVILVSLIQDYSFPLSVALGVLFSLGFSILVSIFFSSSFLIVIILFLFYPLVYYVSGSGAFAIFALTTSFLLFQHYGATKKSILILIPLVNLLILPLLAYKFFFNIHWEQVYFNFVPDLPLVIKYSSSFHLIVFAFFVPAVLFIVSLFTYLKPFCTKEKTGKQNENNRFIQNIPIQFSFAIVSLGVLWYVLVYIKNPDSRKDLILADYYNYNGRWEDAINTIKSSKEYNVMLDYQYVKAIGNNGHLVSDFFKYPKLIGSDVLFPDKLNTSSLAVFCSEYYYDIGFISESMHWAYEAKSVLPYSSRVIKSLVLTNIIMGNYPAAGKFLGVLDKAFYCNEFVSYYSSLLADTMLIAKDSEIMGKRKIMPKNVLVPGEIGERFKTLISADSSNRKAFEYMGLYYLLNHRLGNFLELYNKAGFQYQNIPEPFEEALFILMVRSKLQTANLYPISEATKTMMIEYTQIMKQFGDRKDDAKATLYSRFKDRYMYYLFYESPMVTKAVLETREVREYQK